MDAVKLLNYTDDVEFSAEDAVRSDLNFLVEILNVSSMPVRGHNVPDTVGYSMPSDWGKNFGNTNTRVNSVGPRIVIMIWEWQSLILLLLSRRALDK